MASPATAEKKGTAAGNRATRNGTATRTRAAAATATRPVEPRAAPAEAATPTATPKRAKLPAGMPKANAIERRTAWFATIGSDANYLRVFCVARLNVGNSTPETIAAMLGIDRKIVQTCLTFWKKAGLVEKAESGSYSVGPAGWNFFTSVYGASCP